MTQVLHLYDVRHKSNQAERGKQHLTLEKKKKTTPANTLGFVLNQNILHKPGRDDDLTAFFQLKD